MTTPTPGSEECCEAVIRIGRCSGCEFEQGAYCLHDDAVVWERGADGSLHGLRPFLWDVEHCPLHRGRDEERMEDHDA